MSKTIFRYIISFILFSSLSIIFIDIALLPFLTKKGNEIYLPDVKSMNIEDAKSILKDFNLKIHYKKYNIEYKEDEVIDTSPRAFTKVKKGREIKISLASAKKDFIMEDFIDKSYRNTKLLLDRNNIIIDTTIYEYSEKIKKDNIIYHYPKSGKKVEDNTKLTLIVSSGNPPDYYIVPNLINLSLNSALKKIAESGLLVGNKRYEYIDTLLNNTIIYQDQPAYKRLSMPLEINLTISKDMKNE
tara:strand:+ start:690 stop:1418 length:729 start_codon:yes stop_codon:yes gene_type:complete